MAGYLGRDEWDYQPRRPSPHRANRSSFYLNPDMGMDGGSLNRTRSQGAQPRPVINVFNDLHNDSYARTDASQVPGAFPSAVPVPVSVPAAGYATQYQPGYNPAYAREEFDRGRRLNDQLADEIAQLRLLERSRSRARSRGHSDAHSPPDFYRYEMEKLEREKQARYDQDRIKAEADLQHMKEDARRRQHEVDEHAERRRILAEYEKKKRDDEERDKEMERRYRAKIEQEKIDGKAREDAAYQKFLLKQKEEKEKEEREEKEEKEKIEQEMRKRLAEKGFAGNQIEAIISDKKKESTSITVYQSSSTPVFAKVHKSYLSVETLRYYDIPYKWDEADSNYIIILREMDKHETNILFEHTKALRDGRLLIEAPKKEKEYAFYRKRERSKSRNRSGEWKSFGILEYKK